ncbi:MAG: arginine--tRNA ligase [Candidatus Aenigmarchaeota archaeon]|nr:arginine--tRNA ligase [Candidatus Aenigmarchaeota archaeon]
MQNLWLSLKQEIAKTLDVSIDEIEEPERYGDFAYPCFSLSKRLKKDPKELAKELAKKLKVKHIEKIEAMRSYINFYVDWKEFGQELLKIIDEKYGGFTIKDKKALIEHTSINPNASPHVGRARNAIIGDSLVRLIKFLGYETEVHYLVNDVGKQIATLVYGAMSEDIKKLKFEDLLEIYIKTSKKVEENPEDEKKVFEILLKFEKGHKETMDLFKRIVSLCVKGQADILSELGINYDYFDYESDYIINKKTDEVLEKLEKTDKIFTDENGRKVLDLKGFDIPMESPAFVLLRSDGTSLYNLKDIAYTIDKIKRAKDLNIVILGEDHKLYFKQLSAALKILGYEPPKVTHYSFVLLPTGKMSTRKGELVLLRDFIKEVYEKALKEIEKRYPKLSKDEKEKRAKKVAVGAVRYSVVKVSPEKNVIFVWDEVLKFDGNTGPYLQYTYARANSILKKAKIKHFDSKYLKDEKEKEILKLLSRYPQILEKVLKELKPHYVANYLYELSDAFNRFYQTLPVLNSEENLKNARLKLVDAVKTVLETGLKLLGIPILEKM